MSKKHIVISELEHHIGNKKIFGPMNCTIGVHQRVGVVGVNGAGKSTFLKLIHKALQPTFGSIAYNGELTTGYLEQLQNNTNQTLVEYLKEAFSTLLILEKEMKIIEEQMSQGDMSDSVLARYGELQTQYQSQDGYSYELRIAQVLQGLGFKKEESQRALSTFSGGERTKIQLARILLDTPDILLLDEPTNFLDMEAVEWLEYFLTRKWKNGLVIVSHDRTFLDHVTSETIEVLPERPPEYYSVSYTGYIQEREKRYEQRKKSYEKQQEELLRQDEIIRRLRAGSRAGMAQSRIKQVEKVALLEQPFETNIPKFSFKRGEESEEKICTIKDMFIGYDEESPLYYIGKLEIKKGNRIGILGPNGSGKSSLVKTLLEAQSPLSGDIFWGKHIRTGYYAQTLSHLNEKHSILEEIGIEYPTWSDQQIRSYMGKFLFIGDDIFKKIGALSGGERARVAFAKLSLHEYNFLILDEPTNHLDYYAREALEDALQRYHGTVLFISHDRYFIDKVADHLWMIDPLEGSVKKHYGNYTDYLEREAKGSFYFESDEHEEQELTLGEMGDFVDIDDWAKDAKRKKKKKKRFGKS